MKVNEYRLIYEDAVKKLKSVREIECKEFVISPDDEKEETVEKIVESLTEMLNENFSLGYLVEEHLFLIAMDAQYKILGIFEISHGTETSCSAGVKEIFTRLLMIGAEKFIEFHNHPRSGTISSNDDIKSWQHLKEVAEIFDIEMLTSAIISGNAWNYLEDV